MIVPRCNFTLLALALLLPAGITACSAPTQPTPATFDDHSVPSLASTAQFEAIAAQRASNTAVEFVITRFLADGESIRFLKSSEFTLHDQWYWFRLLNHEAVDGVTDAAPVDVGRRFAHRTDIVAWAETQRVLPLDLTFVDDGGTKRLYSPHFYDLALFNPKKTLGIGTLLHFQADPGGAFGETWAIELEYQHVLSRAELVDYFAILQKNLPAGVGDALKILVRAPQHEVLLQQLTAVHDPLAARFIHYSDVTPKVNVDVAAPGIVAGRLRIVRSGQTFAGVRASDIVIAEDPPSSMPPCAALISQTSLDALAPDAAAALVRSASLRGAPVAVDADILADPAVDALSRVFAPAILTVRAPSAGERALTLTPITEDQFAQYRQLSTPPPAHGPDVDAGALPYAYDVGGGEIDDGLDVVRWTPAIGEDAAGLASVFATKGAAVSAEPRAVALSVRAYVEHMAPLSSTIATIIADSDFAGDERVRTLALEGFDGFRVRHPDQPSFPQTFLDPRPATDVLKQTVLAGGVTALVKNAPVDGGALDAIATSLAGFDVVELSASSNLVGHAVDARAFARVGHGADELSNALRSIWSSYWRVDAFEERRLANIDSTTGALGVLATPAALHEEIATFVHARGAAAAFDGDEAVRDVVTRVATARLARANAEVPLADASATEALAFTIRDGVIAAVRSLDVAGVLVSSAVDAMPIPRDVLDHARSIEQRTCNAGALTATFTEVTTEALDSIDVGFAQSPFTAFVVVQFVDDVPALNATAGSHRSVVHTDYAFTHPSTSPWQIELDVSADQAAQHGLGHIAFDGATLAIDSFSAAASCNAQLLFESPSGFLQSIVDADGG